MSNQTVTITVAAATGLVVALAVSALGPFGRNKAAVPATIVVNPGGTGCVARTFPATLLVGKKDVVQWTVTGDFTGNCTGIIPANIELQFVGPCQPNGDKVASLPLPELFEEAGELKGRKIKRTMKRGDVGCFAYRVMHAGVELEDPELEIVQF